MRPPVVIILVLVWVKDLLGPQGHRSCTLDTPALIKRLRLRGSTEERDVEPEELHKAQLSFASFVAQKCAHVVDAVHHPGDHGHGDHG